MDNSFWQMMAGTPWWVFVLVAYLLKVGYQATKPRTVPVRQLFILAMLFVSISMANLLTNIQPTPVHLAIWFCTATLGTGLGWLQLSMMKVKAIKETASIQFPGTWSLLGFILIIFVVRYYLGYQSATNSAQDIMTHLSKQLSLFYGLFSGYLIGRYLYARHCLKTATA